MRPTTASGFETCVFAAIALATAALMPQHARAAGAAYQVDTADVSDPGNCKIESWVSFGSNRDFFGAVSPSCVFSLGRPVEVSVQGSRARSDGEWDSGLAPKAKVNVIPTAVGSFGLALSGTTGFDVKTRQDTGIALAAPLTYRFSEGMRVNLNVGWQWERLSDRHFLTYGLGYDWRSADNVYTLTAEVFGLAGSADEPGVTRPRFQTGLRWRPIDRWSIDLIYGRNITGENANWLTIATILRFPGGGKQADDK